MTDYPRLGYSRKLSQESLIDSAEIGGATPLWEWIGDGATVFSY